MCERSKGSERKRHAAAARSRAPARSVESESRNEATHPSTRATVACDDVYDDDELEFDPGLAEFIAYLGLLTSAMMMMIAPRSEASGPENRQSSA